MWGGLDVDNPAGDLMLRGNGKDAWDGWPTAPKLEAVRDRWLLATDLAAQKALAAEMQRRHSRTCGHAAGPVLPAGRVPEHFDGHDEGPDPVHWGTAGLRLAGVVSAASGSSARKTTDCRGLGIG